MFKVINKGLLTTVQDVKGRQGVQYLGFPPSGAMDTLALTVGNVLVGMTPMRQDWSTHSWVRNCSFTMKQ